MAKEQRNRDQKVGQDRQSKDQPRKAEKSGQHRDDDKNRGEQKKQERGSSGQQGRKP